MSAVIVALIVILFVLIIWRDNQKLESGEKFSPYRGQELRPCGWVEWRTPAQYVLYRKLLTQYGWPTIIDDDCVVWRPARPFVKLIMAHEPTLTALLPLRAAPCVGTASAATVDFLRRELEHRSISVQFDTVLLRCADWDGLAAAYRQVSAVLTCCTIEEAPPLWPKNQACISPLGTGSPVSK